MGVVDVAAAFRRSVALGVVVMGATVLLALGAGLAFRKRFAGSGLLFYVSVASLIMPSIVVSLGIGLQFRLIDTAAKSALESGGMSGLLEGYGTAMGLFTSALGAHLTWTLPFGLLIMLAVFNRFNPAYEEAASDLGAAVSELSIALGEVAREFNLYSKITGAQRIDLFGARLDQLPHIWGRLIEAGFESGHAYGKALRTVKSCVGSTWCRFGQLD